MNNFSRLLGVGAVLGFPGSGPEVTRTGEYRHTSEILLLWFQTIALKQMGH